VNGSEPQGSIQVSVNGGLYSILLGNTAIQGMSALDPTIFQQHSDSKLRVWFSDGVNGFQQLSPDRHFASVPYAFSAQSATSAEMANTAIAVQNGAITKSMLNQVILNDLNRTITKEMLSQDIKDDLNRTIGVSQLSSEVRADLNRTITKSMLSQEVLNELNSSSGGGGVVPGSLLAVPRNQSVPSGYSLYEEAEPKDLVWEEKAPVSVARFAYDGVEVLGGKIYFVGGKDGSGAKNIAERYDPVANTWETLANMSAARHGVACAVLNGKLYAIGGVGLSSVEVFDPSDDTWSAGLALPSEVNHGTAITADGKIYLIGGANSSNQNLNQVLCFDPSSNQWSTKANMPTARHGAKLVWFENRIWAIGGRDPNMSKVESFDPSTDSWRAEASLTTSRGWPVAWVANDRIYVGGGTDGSFLNSIEVYDPATKQWASAGNFPENKFVADAVLLNDRAYVVAGSNGSVHSSKVFAADLNASVSGVFDLYRKDGNASSGVPVAEVADGSITTNQLSEQILKYLKPEITTQPQAQTVFADTNASFSVSAEGKYLTYQWKKNGTALAGETNATLTITDANSTQHDGNYTVVVSNDFGSVESGDLELLIASWIPSLSDNLEIWLDATDESTIVQSSNLVSIWEDKSNLGNDASQNTTTYQPTYSLDGMSGLPGLKFDSDKLQFSNNNLLNKMCFAVINPISFHPPASGIILASSSFNVQLRVNAVSSDNSSLGKIFYASEFPLYNTIPEGLSVVNSDNLISVNENSIIGFIFDETFGFSTNGIYLDSQVSRNSSGASTYNQIGMKQIATEPFDGCIGEIIIINSVENTVRQKVEGYLAHKWGLTANLPVDHPYKTSTP
jgi:N-acetylneuraminic acid mutarotase